jgi:hypothetical protein
MVKYFETAVRAATDITRFLAAKENNHVNDDHSKKEFQMKFDGVFSTWDPRLN